MPRPPSTIRVKRVYDAPASNDGIRVLVDRIWPRGVKKETARVDHWLKDLAPSTALRQWFGHEPAKWDEFRRRYWRELAEKSETVEELRRLGAGRRLTLVYAAKDQEHSNAAALRQYLERPGA